MANKLMMIRKRQNMTRQKDMPLCQGIIIIIFYFILILAVETYYGSKIKKEYKLFGSVPYSGE